jgi:ribose transport system substrate-binding protein
VSTDSEPNGRPRFRTFAPVTVMVLLAVLAAACSSSATSAVSGGSSSGSGSTAAEQTARAQAVMSKYYAAPTSILQTQALPAAPPRGKKIVALGIASPTDQTVRQGFNQAATALGWTVKTIIYDPANPETVQAAFNEALSLHPDMVTISGTAPQLWGTDTLAKYQAANIPILVTSSAPVQTSRLILGVPAGCGAFTDAGRVLAEWFIADSKATGKALFESASAYPALVCVQQGFSDTVAANCSACSVQVLKVTLPQISAGQVPSAVVNALKANPSLQYALFDAGDFADGINSALDAAGLSAIKVGGFLMDTPQAAALRNKTQAGWLAYSDVYLGYAGADLAARYFAGQPTSTLDNEAPLQMFTPSNIGSTTQMDAPVDALAQFEKLWQISS